MPSLYRLTVIGPGDEVLDEIPLDGLYVDRYLSAGQYLSQQISQAMGRVHVAACAALDPPEED